MDLERVEIREVSPDRSGSSDDDQGPVVKRRRKTFTVRILYCSNPTIVNNGKFTVL